MSTVDVGDAVEVTFSTVTGATVVMSLYDPNENTVVDAEAVAEEPAGSGAFPATFTLTAPGIWKATYTASGVTAQVENYYMRAIPITGPSPLVTVGEIGAQFGPMTAAQESLSKYLARAASLMVRGRFKYIDDQIANGQLDGETVGLSVANMVLRVLRNPNGLRAETVGPFSRTYDTSVAAGLLVISKDDEQGFTPAPTQEWAPAASVRVRAGLAPWGGHRHGRW